MNRRYKSMQSWQKPRSKRFSVNKVSAITNQGKIQFMIYSDSMNADRYIEFMKQLIESNLRMIYLIFDILSAHRSKKVKQWAEDYKEDIALFDLPTYSSERIPDEYFNCDLKRGLSIKKSSKNKKTSQNNVQNHKEILQDKPDQVMKYFNHNSIRFAAT